MERYEFEYNIARMSVTALLNISGKQLNKDITPSELWPDWNTDHIPDDGKTIDPIETVKITRSAIDLLNSRQSV